jgi:tRNA A37 N6-isopentenylltransferase MiaA
MLQEKSVEELQRMLQEQGIPLPENAQNPRHLIRSIETGGDAPSRSDLRPRTLVLGLSIERELLEQKVRQRVELMVEQGFVDEVRHLADRYGWDIPALQAPGYRAFRLYLEGSLTLEEAKTEFVRNDMQYAKRQKTWFKRDPNIHWISKTEEAVDLVTTFLNK